METSSGHKATESHAAYIDFNILTLVVWVYYMLCFLCQQMYLGNCKAKQAMVIIRIAHVATVCTSSCIVEM